MITTFFQLRAIRSVSVSKPTKKRKRDKPIVANNLRRGREEGGMMFSLNPGILPNAVPPRRIPARSSPSTAGWLNLLKTGEMEKIDDREWEGVMMELELALLRLGPLDPLITPSIKLCVPGSIPS